MKFLLEINKSFCFSSVKHEGLFKSDYPIWPPFRIPKYDHPQMANVQQILRSGVLHHFLLLCLNAVRSKKIFFFSLTFFLFILVFKR